MNHQIIKASEWFNTGDRFPYNPKTKKIELTAENDPNGDMLHAFHSVSGLGNNFKNRTWLSFLPGFPDGSYGWSRVDQLLGEDEKRPKLYVEYIGQGDSDKPENYPYGIKERADLVEAFWDYYDIEETNLVTFDYSSLVAMELLRRQEESKGKGTKIRKVLMINGGYFTDAHSHPITTTPMLKTKFGKMGTKMIQKSPTMFRFMMKDLWSKEYGVTNEEMNEAYDAITRRNGALFLHNAAHFVDEHKQKAKRLDLQDICKQMHEEVQFYIVGSEKDQFEPQQVVKAIDRLTAYEVDIRMVPGGHMTTSEHPDLLANIIREISK